MKKLILLFALSLAIPYAKAQDINRLLDSLKIRVTTISFHPDGDILISTGLNRDDMSQYLILLTENDGKLKIDTLRAIRPNRSAFSKGGEYIVYNFKDPI